MSEATSARADDATARHGEHHIDDLLLDRIDAFRVLRADTPEEKGAILEHLAKLGPLTPVASYAVEQMTRWIVKGYQNSLVTRLRKLYERREANSVWGSPEHVMLRRARINAIQVEQGFKGDQLGLPTFLLGGAILSSIVSALRAAFLWAFKGGIGTIIFAGVLGLVFAGLAWAALYAAGVARRRIRLSTEQPVKALFETIGACGNPPGDDSYTFAVYAIVLLVLAWILIPTGIWLVVSNIHK